jgi:hypothetical protein
VRDIEQHRLLAGGQCRREDPLGLNGLAILAGPEHHVADPVVENRLLLLRGIERADQREGLVVLVAKRRMV